jgi:hypothetical protein
MVQPTYQYPSLASIVNDRLAYGIAASKIVGELTGVTIDSSFINGLADVATGGSLDTSLLSGTIDASLISGTIDSGNLDYPNLNAVLGLANVATGGTLAASLVTGLADVATGGSLASTLITGLANVATSGSYNDLSGRPGLATVATTGSYADLSGKPGLATVATSGSYADLSGKPGLATVATSGSYADLSGTPGLANVATGGTLAASLVTGLANVATGGTLDASLIYGPILPSQLSPLSMTPGTFYICDSYNVAPTKMIQGSTNPALMNFAVAQCVKFANAPQEYYNTAHAPCTNIVTDAPNAYITCLEIIIGTSALSFTDVSA